MTRALPGNVWNLSTVVCVLGLMLLAVVGAHAALLSESAIGPEAGLNNSDLYENSLDAWFQPEYNVTQVITSGSCSAALPCLWVPWYGSSSSCIAAGQNESGDLKAGSSCDSGEHINASNNCMVSDEFSQVGLDVSMGRNQTRFQQFHNTVNVINSSRARIPAWRVYRSGNSIESCRTNINGNCDTASDATARIIIAHWNAANNSYFTNLTQKNNYAGLALNLSIAMVQSELTFSCKNSTLGSGMICWWLRAGNQSSLTTTDGSYTGYYPDAEIAFLMTCSQTGNLTYCAIAGNLSLNEKQAAKWNGTAFRAPPGRSFKWDNFSTASVPYANCTNTCGDSAMDGDETWDASDAIREFFEGVANYYDRFLMGTNVLANSTSYMGQWVAEKMVGNLNSLPIQYYPNGNNSGSNQSGYVAQAMQAAGIISQNNATQVNTTVWNAMNHYTANNHKWDSAACPGVYNSAFPIRMLGVGMGRDAGSFGTLGNGSSPSAVVMITPSTAYTNDTLLGFCNATDPAILANVTFEYAWFRNGTIFPTSFPSCFQESATVSTSCGGLGTGSYGVRNCDLGLGTCDSDPLEAGGSCYDGSYAATPYCQELQSGSNNRTLDVWMNETKPALALSDSAWQVYAYNSSTTVATYFNVSVPAGCFAQAPLQFRYTSWSFMHSGVCSEGGTNYSCYNGTAWQLLNNASMGLGNSHSGSCGVNGLGYLIEEAMQWHIGGSYAVNHTYNVGNVTPALTSRADTWVFACMPKNSSYSGSWANSTGVTIQNTIPVNNWSANNVTLNHNASMAFGNYCLDADGDGLVESSNDTLFPALANGSLNFTANISSSGVHVLNVSCSDGTANVTATTSITITNTLPNVTTTSLVPLPAQAGSTLNITYSCTDPDNDVCNVSVFYAWFKNGLLNTSIIGPSFGAGNFTTGDNITGSVRVFDGNLNSSWRNTSIATVGDTTPPVLSAVNVSPLSTTTAGTVSITATCSDNNAVGTVAAEVTDALSVRANFTMANVNGSSFAYSYAPPIAGTYSARVFCTDGNGNVANSSSTVFIVTQQAGSGGGGGGGGGGQSITIVQGDHCDFRIVRPTNGFVNTLCPTGERSGSFEFILENEESTTQTYSTAFSGVDCQIDAASFSVVGKGQHSSIISNCACPSNVSLEGSINITTELCTGELPIKLYNGVLSRLLFDQNTLISFLIGVFILFIIVLGIIFLRS